MRGKQKEYGRSEEPTLYYGVAPLARYVFGQRLLRSNSSYRLNEISNVAYNTALSAYHSSDNYAVPAKGL